MTEFWRRWHISLSSWFRDYVYLLLEYWPEWIACAIAALPAGPWLRDRLAGQEAPAAVLLREWAPKLAALALLGLSYMKLATGSFNRLSVSLLSRALEQRGVGFLDVRAAFDAMGRPGEYGSQVDNHYTMAGAFETYRLVMEQIAAETGLDFPILGPEDVILEALPNDYLGSRERRLMGVVNREEHPSILRPVEEIPFSRSDGGIPGASEVYALGFSDSQPLNYDLYMGGDIANTVIDTHREDLPGILIYGDSFTNAPQKPPPELICAAA